LGWTLDVAICSDGPGSGDHCRATSVLVVELLTVLCGLALKLLLARHGRSAWAAHGRNFGRTRSYVDTASATVVGDAGDVVDDDWTAIDVGDADADAVDGAVVVEVVAAPVSAVVTVTGIAEAIVDAAVEADMRPPVAAMEVIAVAVEAPVTGGPERSIVRWRTPDTGNPVVADGSPAPVAGGPEIVRGRSFGLIVLRQGWGWLIGFEERLLVGCRIDVVVAVRRVVGIVLIGGWLRILSCGDRLIRGRGGLRRIRILLTGLLGLGLRTDAEDSCRLRGGGGLLLAIVCGGQVGVGGIGAEVARDCRSVGSIVATREGRCSQECCHTE
jgi:hypothetical protein